jgi:hypothetical protein
LLLYALFIAPSPLDRALSKKGNRMIAARLLV